MIGASAAMLGVYDLIERVAPSDVPVLVQGETGTGKELVARALHEYGPRKGGRLMAENCAAVPENLLESELFGHKKGAFTGATQDREGHFVAADGGTVFLDEIGDMPLPMQAKLLRVLQDGEVRPVGSNASRRVDVRIVAATHRDLVEAAKDGSFREDLLFRLNVITIHLPPLRERAGDVERLVRSLLPGIAEEVGREARITDAALALSPPGAGRGTSGSSRTSSESRGALRRCDRRDGPVPADRRRPAPGLRPARPLPRGGLRSSGGMRSERPLGRGFSLDSAPGTRSHVPHGHLDPHRGRQHAPLQPALGHSCRSAAAPT